MSNELVTQEQLDEASLPELAELESMVKEARKNKRQLTRDRVAELKSELEGLKQRRAKRGSKSGESSEETPKKKKKRNRS